MLARVLSFWLLAAVAVASDPITVKPPADSPELRRPIVETRKPGTLQEVTAFGQGKVTWAVWKPADLQCAIKDAQTLHVTVPNTEAVLFCVVDGQLQVIVIQPDGAQPDKPIDPVPPNPPVIPDGWRGVTKAIYQRAVIAAPRKDSCEAIEAALRTVAKNARTQPGVIFGGDAMKTFEAVAGACEPIGAGDVGAKTVLQFAQETATGLWPEPQIPSMADCADFFEAVADALKLVRERK